MCNKVTTDGLSWFIAPPDWDPTQPNPFTPDGAYGPAWSGYIIHPDDARGLYGRSTAGLFCQGMNLSDKWLAANVADFLRYETAHGRHVILSAPPTLDLPTFVADGLACTPTGPVVRPKDEPVVVHSTSPAAWKLIQKSGCMKSLARLRREDLPGSGMGFAEFGEPADYAEHVMFTPRESISAEMVVNSLLQRKFIYDDNAPYTPGVRLYFDAFAIIRDGRAVHDGVHHLKVHDHLPLTPYLLAAVTADTLGPRDPAQPWTPRTFLAAANAWFDSRRQGR